MIDFFKTLLSDFDPMMLLPDLGAMMDKLDVALRVVVMAGPLCLLGLGLLYLLFPPAEANHIFGYRHFWGMSSVEAWQFTQKTAGLVWTGLGLVMTVVMAFLCNGYRDMTWEAICSMVTKVLRMPKDIPAGFSMVCSHRFTRSIRPSIRTANAIHGSSLRLYSRWSRHSIYVMRWCHISTMQHARTMIQVLPCVIQCTMTIRRQRRHTSTSVSSCSVMTFLLHASQNLVTRLQA